MVFRSFTQLGWLVCYLLRFYLILKIISRTFILSLSLFHSLIYCVFVVTDKKKKKRRIRIPLYFHLRYILTNFQRILELWFWVYTSSHFSCSQCFYLGSNGFVWALKSEWCVYGFLSRAHKHIKFNGKWLFSSSTLKHRRLGKSRQRWTRAEWKNW